MSCHTGIFFVKCKDAYSERCSKGYCNQKRRGCANIYDEGSFTEMLKK